MAQCIYRFLLPVGGFLAFSRPVVRIRPSGVRVLRHPNRFGSENSIGKLGDRLMCLARFVVVINLTFWRPGPGEVNGVPNPISCLQPRLVPILPLEVVMNISSSHIDREPPSFGKISRP